MKQIIIVTIALLSAITIHAQTPFNGRIRTTSGSGVKATIEVKGSDKHTRADGKGRFGLTDIGENDTLRIIYRRDTMEIPVAGRKSIDIVWTEEQESLQVSESEELMNFGFGYVKRRESTDFSSGISGERLRSTSVSNLLQAILICCPSLRYINGQLCIRSQNSVHNPSGALILCDGMEIPNIDMISIYDVSSVEIIKNSNMYGFRGVNGVILIKTVTADDAFNRLR